MKKALIINNIAEAIHFIQNRSVLIKDDALIFSTNISVDVFLKEKYGVESCFLGHQVSSHRLTENLRIADAYANTFVDALDFRFSEGINRELNLKGMRFFKALYSYEIYLKFISCLNLYDAFKEVIKTHSLSEFTFFDNKTKSFYAAPSSIGEILSGFSNLKINSIEYREGARIKSDFNKVLKALSRPLLSSQKVIKKIKSKAEAFKYKRRRSELKRIVLAEPLYDLSFLHHDYLSEYDVLYYPMDSIFPYGFKDKAKKNFDLSINLKDVTVPLKTDERSFLNGFVIKNVEEDFNRNINLYAQGLAYLDQMNKEQRISFGLWGNSPCGGFKALVFEYLLAHKIPVLGAQHGGLLGNIYDSDVAMTDTDRCSDYITYGFNKEDLRKIYPQKDFSGVTFHELGTTKTVQERNINKPVVDILFPITNTMSMLEGGMLRDNPDYLLENQLALINYLNQSDKHKVVIKPLPNVNYDNCAALPILEKAKNIHIEHSLGFKDYMESYQVKAVLLEHATTTLYEALAYDVEIFLLTNNLVRPIEDESLKDLKKRIYYFENPQDLIRSMDLFLEGRLEKKRDTTFYNRHVYKRNSKENILKLVKDLAGSGH